MADFKFQVTGVIEGPDEASVIGALAAAVKAIEVTQDDKLFAGGVRTRKLTAERIEPKAST